jgi:transmembrane 9 superfamily protein 2/4
MREPQMCQIVCKISVGDKEAKVLKEKIEDEYRVNMYVSNLVFGLSKNLLMSTPWVLP